MTPPDLPPPRHGLPVPARPAAALDVPADAGRPHPDDAALVEQLRCEVRGMSFEPLTDGQVAAEAVAWPGAAATNAAEGNPFDAADWALTRMLLEERVPADASAGIDAAFARGCRLNRERRGRADGGKGVARG